MASGLEEQWLIFGDLGGHGGTYQVAHLALHLHLAVSCRGISENCPPKVVVIAVKCFNLLWSRGREHFYLHVNRCFQ